MSSMIKYSVLKMLIFPHFFIINTDYAMQMLIVYNERNKPFFLIRNNEPLCLQKHIITFTLKKQIIENVYKEEHRNNKERVCLH